MVKASLSLLAIGGVCGSLLVATDWLTAADINFNREQGSRALIADILGEALPPNIDVQQDTTGDCNDWVLQHVQSNGYAGTIDTLVLWRADSGGLVTRVTRHRETPGIGDFIDHRRAPWIAQFDNQRLLVYENLDNVSGATITTRAIVRAVQSAQARMEDYCAG